MSPNMCFPRRSVSARETACGFQLLQRPLSHLIAAFFIFIVSGIHTVISAQSHLNTGRQKPGEAKTTAQKKPTPKSPSPSVAKTKPKRQQPSDPDKKVKSPWPPGTPPHWVLIRPGGRDAQPTLNEVLARAKTASDAERQIYQKLNDLMLQGSPETVMALIHVGRPAVVPVGDTLLAAVQAYDPLRERLRREAFLLDDRRYKMLEQEFLATYQLIWGCTRVLGEIGDERVLLLLRRINFKRAAQDSEPAIGQQSPGTDLQKDIDAAIDSVTARLGKGR